MPRTIRTKVYQFSELSEQAKERAVLMYERYNNVGKLSRLEIAERLTNPIYQFLANGDMWNGLTN